MVTKKKYGNPLVAYRLQREVYEKLTRQSALLGVRPMELARALVLAGMDEAKYETVRRYFVTSQLELPIDAAASGQEPAKEARKPDDQGLTRGTP